MKSNSSKNKRVGIAVCALAAVMSVTMLAGCGKTMTKKKVGNTTTQTQKVDQGKKSSNSSSKKGVKSNNKQTTAPDNGSTAK